MTGSKKQESKRTHLARPRDAGDGCEGRRVAPLGCRLAGRGGGPGHDGELRPNSGKPLVDQRLIAEEQAAVDLELGQRHEVVAAPPAPPVCPAPNVRVGQLDGRVGREPAVLEQEEGA